MSNKLVLYLVVPVLLFCVFSAPIWGSVSAETLAERCGDRIGAYLQEGFGVCDVERASNFVPRMLSIIIYLIGPLLTVLAISIGGFLIIVQGKDEPGKADAGKQYIKYGILGYILLVSASLLVSIVVYVLGFSDTKIPSFGDMTGVFSSEPANTDSNNPNSSDAQRERFLEQQRALEHRSFSGTDQNEIWNQCKSQCEECQFRNVPLDNAATIDNPEQIVDGYGCQSDGESTDESQSAPGLPNAGTGGIAPDTTASEPVEVTATFDEIEESEGVTLRPVSEKSNIRGCKISDMAGGMGIRRVASDEYRMIAQSLDQLDLWLDVTESSSAPVNSTPITQNPAPIDTGSVGIDPFADPVNDLLLHTQNPTQGVDCSQYHVSSGNEPLYREVCEKYGVEMKKRFGANVHSAIQVAACESRGNPNSINPGGQRYIYKGKTRIADECSVGLFQVNIQAHQGTLRSWSGTGRVKDQIAWLKVPENNIQFAYHLSREGQSWSPWLICSTRAGLLR